MEILSTGPDLYIEFVANSEWPGQGFKANYKFQTFDGENGNGECTYMYLHELWKLLFLQTKDSFLGEGTLQILT